MSGRSFSVAIFILTFLLIGTVAYPDTFNLQEPLPLPKRVPLQKGEKRILLGDDLVPGVRMWVQNMVGSIWHYGTSQSVGGGAGMYLHVPAGSSPSGYVCAYDVGVQGDFKEYTGLSLWIKGDGSHSHAVVSTNYAGSANKFRISLNDTEWHKVYLPWNQWDKPLTRPFWFLAFGLERKSGSISNYYIIDRVRLYKEAVTEPVQPTPDRDPPGLLPARAFVTGQEHIAKTIAKLQTKKPVKIVIAGDSIVAGAQLWYTASAWNRPETVTRFLYFELLGRSLQHHYGYSSVSLPFRSYDGTQKRWKETPLPRVTADLTVMTVALGGGSAQSGFDHLEQILAEKPDLVIWEYGCNDVTFGTYAKYLRPTEIAIAALRKAGCEVVLQTITPGSDLLPKEWMANKSPLEKAEAYNRGVRNLADATGCALADMERAFLARGPQFVGDIYSDNVHPNHMGHEMLSDVLDALITDRDIRIWKHGPVAERMRQ